MEILETVFLKNTTLTWLYALGLFIISLIVLRIIRGIVRHRVLKLAEKTDNDIDDLIAELIGKTHIFMLVLFSLFFGSLILDLPAQFNTILIRVLVAGILLQAALWGNAVIRYLVERYKKGGKIKPA